MDTCKALDGGGVAAKSGGGGAEGGGGEAGIAGAMDELMKNSKYFLQIEADVVGRCWCRLTPPLPRTDSAWFQTTCFNT